MNRVRRALTRALAATLPNAEQTLLLRACLLDAAAVRRAWDAWRAQTSDPVSALSNPRRWARTLLPLLFHSLTRSGVELEDSTRIYLRASLLRERLRFDVFASACEQVLRSMADARVPAILMKGVAFAEALYVAPEHRHCHDIDLLVHPRDAARAHEAALRAGFLPRRPAEGPDHAVFADASGLPLRLHTRPFLAAAYSTPVDELFARSIEYRFRGVSARILCPVDALVHVCGHASSVPGIDALRWACDAWNLIARRLALDWKEVIRRSGEMNVSEIVASRLGYLANELEAPVPAGLWEQTACVSVDASALRAAFEGTLRGGRAGLARSIRAGRDWRASLLLCGWFVSAQWKAAKARPEKL